jgi:signal transduction histidine kinase
MLTRSILQMGALLTIHKEEPLQGQLSAVNDTLNEAMNNIRESVHDLHNESLDLRQTIAEAVDELKGRCEIAMEYDMTEQVPRNVKYCFVAIVKEAVANVIKHSNADQLTVILREHPGFYQMSIEDNGTQIRRNENPGIGLTNMTDRVEALHGTIRFLTEKGFRILISIPK